MEHRRIYVCGTVQGVGFRPFVWRLARQHQIEGTVRNHGDQVVIEACAPSPSMGAFIQGLGKHSLPHAVIERIDIEPMADHPARGRGSAREYLGFQILDSTVPEDLQPRIPPDSATCNACLEEMSDPGNRRYGYPFIQCNDCGPRFTIIESLPFDRSRTTMREFPLCSRCEEEYRDPNNRRFHCQTIACPDCGPRLSWLGDSTDARSDPIMIATHAVQVGQIIAIKGIGGFHLACDARNDAAIARLRRWKGRGEKPFALMARDHELAHSIAHGPSQAWHGLNDWICPIVLMRRNRDAHISPLVAPGLSTIGIMLPYSPLHHLLMHQAQGPWVMTSGNRSDEPLAIDNDDAVDRLSGIADGFLLHNRKIIEMCDDSVVRFRETSHGTLRSTLRRARGMVPEAIPFADASTDILASGADLKGTFCLVRGNRAYVSQPFGDLSNRQAMDSLQNSAMRWEKKLSVTPTRVASDRHPMYFASQWGRERAHRIGTQPFLIQHHHAHLGALMAEHQRDPKAHLLGFVFDGTGYGHDGTIWGGEAIALRHGRFERFASLQPFQLPGGDAAVRFPHRIALSLLHLAGIPWTNDLPCVIDGEPDANYLFKQLLDRQTHCIETTSMGRLFDGVASLLGVRHSITYEAQAAIELEELANQATCTNVNDADRSWLHQVLPESQRNFPTVLFVRELVNRYRSGTPRSELAHWFHRILAAWMTTVAARYRVKHPSDCIEILEIGLSGGVFQNELLLGLAVESLEDAGFRVLNHQQWPCHDGSIALGQAWIASHLSTYPT
ncbi:MAG: carbamoyltransferase HypF [Planctomycetes bacterium]|nr:carbamoyltransferase HypF [Planctomycetota bacterium]